MGALTDVRHDDLGLEEEEIEAVKLALDFSLKILTQQNVFCGKEYMEIVERIQSALRKLQAV